MYDLEFQWDGAVQEISTDGGANWSDLPPDGGYPSSFAQTGSPPVNACGYAASHGAFNGVSDHHIRRRSRQRHGDGGVQAVHDGSQRVRWPVRDHPLAVLVGSRVELRRILPRRRSTSTCRASMRSSPTASTEPGRARPDSAASTAATSCATDRNERLSLNAPARTSAPVSFRRRRFVRATPPDSKKEIADATPDTLAARRYRCLDRAQRSRRRDPPLRSSADVGIHDRATHLGARLGPARFRASVPLDTVGSGVKAVADRAHRGRRPEISVPSRFRHRRDPGRDRRCGRRRSPARREHDQSAGREESFSLERAQLRAQRASKRISPC